VKGMISPARTGNGVSVMMPYCLPY
jgi:hypothetical protein